MNVLKAIGVKDAISVAMMGVILHVNDIMALVRCVKMVIGVNNATRNAIKIVKINHAIIFLAFV